MKGRITLTLDEGTLQLLQGVSSPSAYIQSLCNEHLTAWVIYLPRLERAGISAQTLATLSQTVKIADPILPADDLVADSLCMCIRRVWPDEETWPSDIQHVMRLLEERPDVVFPLWHVLREAARGQAQLLAVLATRSL